MRAHLVEEVEERDLLRATSCLFLAIAAKISAATAAGVFMATSSGWFVAKETILTRLGWTRLIYS